MKIKVAKEAVGEKLNPRTMHKDYLDKIENELVSQGVPFFEPNVNLNITDKYLILPSEITSVTSKELGEYLNAFTQQKVYLRTLLGRIEALVEIHRRAYYESSEDLYRQYSKEKTSETAKDRLINSHPDVQPHYYAYLDYKRKQQMVEYSINNVEDIAFMISREVTRRVGDFSEENRSYNVSKK